MVKIPAGWFWADAARKIPENRNARIVLIVLLLVIINIIISY